MSRAHINRPVLDANGNVLSDIHVRVYEPGTTSLISEPIYLDPVQTAPAQQPMTFTDGVISIYLDVPKRVRIGVQQGVGQEVFFEDIDIISPTLPSPTLLSVTDPETGAATTFVPSFSLQAIVSGPLTVKTNIAAPGLRVVKACTAQMLVAHIGTPPTGSAAIIHAYRVNGSTTEALGDITIPAGASVGSTAISVDCAKGDMIRFDTTQIGSTVAGADINVSVDFL